MIGTTQNSGRRQIDRAHQLTDKGDRGLIGPLQILYYQYESPVGRRCTHQPAEGICQQSACGRCVLDRQRRRQPVGEFREDCCQRSCGGPGPVHEAGIELQQRPQRVGDRPERSPEVRIASRREDRHPGRVGVEYRAGQDGTLADARLAAHEHRGTITRPPAVECGREDGKFGGPPDEALGRREHRGHGQSSDARPGGRGGQRGGQLAVVGYAEFAECRLQIRLDRPRAQEQLLGDLPDRHTVPHRLGNGPFAIGQLGGAHRSALPVTRPPTAQL